MITEDVHAGKLNPNLCPPGGNAAAVSEDPHPLPKIGIDHPASLRSGDHLIIGKRRWNYVGRGGNYGLPGEYRFQHYGDAGDIDKERIYSQSELEAFSEAGFLRRTVPAIVLFPAAKNGYR